MAWTRRRGNMVPGDFQVTERRIAAAERAADRVRKLLMRGCAFMPDTVGTGNGADIRQGQAAAGLRSDEKAG